MDKAAFLNWARAPRFSNTLSKWNYAESLHAGGPYLTERVAIDIDSLRRFPFEANAVLVIADHCGASANVTPRSVLKAQLKRAADLGFDVRAAFEVEMIFLAETAQSMRDADYRGLRQFVPDNKCWSGQTAAQEAMFVAELDDAIRASDINLFTVGGEMGPGCFEATLGATDGLRAADDAAVLRQTVRAFARQRDMTALFMPYVGTGYPGLGGHINLSLVDRSTGRNLFSDPAGTTNLLARRFIAGMSRVVPDAFAMCAQSVNAYRRLAPGSWAPKSLTWAEWTFTTAIRSVPDDSDNARLEFRVPAADCNTHLALALMIGAGLEGIESELGVTDPSPDLGPDEIPAGASRFPSNLGSAAETLRASGLARKLFGDPFIDNFADACASEHASLARAVSRDEFARYAEG
ncbi:MAG: hypothetical protein JHD35_03030 [Sphingopyxis sp.]|nr:hypothetical protein [Sphingopyxis sp.]